MPLRDIKDEVDKRFAPKEHEIKALFPAEWTEADQISFMAIGFKLKVMGFEWFDFDKLKVILAAIETKGLILRDGLKFKRNPDKVYKDPMEITPLIPLDAVTKRHH